MAENKGRAVQVFASPDDTTYSAIGEIQDCDMGLGGNTLDVSKFGDDTIRRILGLKDCSWQLNGFYDPTDADGQKAIQSSLLNDTPLYLKFVLVPGATAGLQGFKQQVVCSKYDIKAAVASTVDVSITCDGSGSITAV